jgi:hypothetical protein
MILSLVLTLTVVSGRVVDSSGKPVVGAVVQTFQYSRHSQESLGAPSDHAELALQAKQQTNDRGEFRVINVDPGKYFLRVAPTEQGELSRLGASKMKEIEVSSGEEVRLPDTVLTPATMQPIRLIVTDATGEQRAGAPFVTLLGSFATTGLVDATPAVRPDEPGKYRVCVLLNVRDGGGPSVRARSGCAEVDYIGASMTVPLTVTKATARLTGRVVLEQPDGSAVPFAGVNVGGLSIGMPGSNTGGTSGSNGLFTSPNAIQDGPFQVRFLAVPDGYYVSGIRQGPRDVLTSDVIVAGEDTNLDVRVVKGAGILRGKVSAPAVIALVPTGALDTRSDKMSTHRSTRTNPDGTFEIRGLIPGSYRAYAFETLEYGAYMDTSFFKPFEEQGALVEIPRDASLSIELKLVR